MRNLFVCVFRTFFFRLFSSGKTNLSLARGVASLRDRKNTVIVTLSGAAGCHNNKMMSQGR